ncbi:hypothetical protein CCACVL1_22906 [Corchorus capsularis]|uniref:Uncharacterized protein n=1 Tax=Corchorus capsularis TaxID=210143 RepID=A0A1R3GVX3_COCAP|nr:hypothetical protein CCACVL1_22906 [Corchorus capsularis]
MGAETATNMTVDAQNPQSSMQIDEQRPNQTAEAEEGWHRGAVDGGDCSAGVLFIVLGPCWYTKFRDVGEDRVICSTLTKEYM